MILKNVLNINKKKNIRGNVFNLFYPDLSTSILFDSDLSEPIIWGNKSVVMMQLKNIYKITNVPITSEIIVVSYVISTEGYKKIDLYKGKIETLGKYIKRY